MTASRPTYGPGSGQPSGIRTMTSGLYSSRRASVFPAFQASKGAFDDLHVLLRHRLFRQAEVVEAALGVKVSRQTRDLAVADVEHVHAVARIHARDVDSTRRSPPERTNNHE